MDISKARLLKYGQSVQCPEDRGQKAFTGIVRSEDCATAQMNLNHKQDCYIWVTVSGLGGVKSVWPSNRLS